MIDYIQIQPCGNDQNKWQVNICLSSIGLSESSQPADDVHLLCELPLPSKETSQIEMQQMIIEKAHKVAAALASFDQKRESPEDIAAFRYLFSDNYTMQKKIHERSIWVRFGAEKIDEQTALIVAAIFYEGVYLFLQEGERYKNWNARLVHLMSAWQWYIALTHLIPDNNKPGQIQANAWMSAYRALLALLEDASFDLAAQWILEIKDANKKNHLLAREQLRLGMVLVDTATINWERKGNSKVDLTKNLDIPLAAPGLDKISWKTTKILPVLFEHNGGKNMLRRLIADWLLARYDFQTSLRLSCLLRTNKPQQFIWQFWVIVTWFFLWFSGLLAVNLGLSPQSFAESGTPFINFLFAFLSGPGIIGCMSVLWFDKSALVNMILPRLSGGIALGYIAFVLQEDAVNLALRMLDPWPLPLAVLWIGVLLLGLSYLYFDVLPRGRRESETLRRTVSTMCMALFISMAMGLLMVAFSTAAFGSFCSEPFRMTPPGGCFIGPFGWVSLRQWIVLVPLALCTGLITQFLLEEKAVTEPVWSSD